MDDRTLEDVLSPWSCELYPNLDVDGTITWNAVVMINGERWNGWGSTIDEAIRRAVQEETEWDEGRENGDA